MSTTWVYNDGGRQESGYKGVAGDCVARAAAIAMGIPYEDAYKELAFFEWASGKRRSARNGIDKRNIRKFMESHEWEWTPTMFIGSGCKVHLRSDELPSGVLVVNLSKHVVAVIDGVVHDTYDSTRDGTRCVYGYWKAPGPGMRSGGQG